MKSQQKSKNLVSKLQPSSINWCRDTVQLQRKWDTLYRIRCALILNLPQGPESQVKMGQPYITVESIFYLHTYTMPDTCFVSFLNSLKNHYQT